MNDEKELPILQTKECSVCHETKFKSLYFSPGLSICKKCKNEKMRNKNRKMGADPSFSWKTLFKERKTKE